MAKSDLSSFAKRIRAVEKDFTKGLMKWRIRRGGLPPADEETLDKSSERVVDEAHRIVKKRGKTVIDELKQARQEFLKAYREDDNE